MRRFASGQCIAKVVKARSHGAAAVLLAGAALAAYLSANLAHAAGTDGAAAKPGDILDICGSLYFPEAVKRGDALGWSRLSDDDVEDWRANSLPFSLDATDAKTPPPELSGRPEDIVQAIGWHQGASPFDGRVVFVRAFGFAPNTNCFVNQREGGDLEKEVSSRLGSPTRQNKYNAGRLIFWQKDKTSVWMVQYSAKSGPATYMFYTTSN